MTLSVTYEGLEHTVTMLASARDSLGAELTKLESEAAALAGRWSGDAQVAYVTAQHRWSVQLEELASLLAEAATLVEDAAASYRATDAAVAAEWRPHG